VLAEAKFHNRQLLVTIDNGDPLFGHQTNHFWHLVWSGILKKLGYIKQQGPFFFVTQLPVFLCYRQLITSTRPTSLSFVFLLAHFLNLLLLLRYIQICAITMPPPEYPQALPSFNLTLRSEHYKTVLPNLSYPSRPNTHVPWSGPSGPLLFSKATRAAIATSNPNIQVQVPTTANICFDTRWVPGVFHRINMLIWHNWSMIVQKLKLIKQKLFGAAATCPTVTAGP